MLDKIDLNQDLSRKEYKKLLPQLQRRLYDLEKACWDNKIASILVFEGWDAAGKGSAISTLTARLDPRGFKLHPIQAPRTFEKNRPWLWRFWLRLPNHGEMAIFDRSWYGRVLVERVDKLLPKSEWKNTYRDIVEFERMQSEDGVVIVKFWLHISKKEQKRRFKKIEKDPLESWRVTEADWHRHEQYDEYLQYAEEMLEQTDTEHAPWTIVEATSKWFTRRKIFDTVIAALEERLGDLAPETKRPSAKRTKHEADLRDEMDRLNATGGEDDE